MRYVSLFAGAGGLDLGARLADRDLHPALVTDIDADCVNTVRAGLGFPPCGFIREDIGYLLSHGLISLFKGEAELVIGGPPCQGFSVAGKMDPNDPRSEMVFRFMDAVDRIRPVAFLMENVAALATKRWSLVLNRLVSRANDMGYDVHVRVLNARDYGVAQNRQRTFLFGMPRGCLPQLPPVSRDIFTARSELEKLLPCNDPDVIPSAKITLAKNPVLRLSPYAGFLVNGRGRIIDLDAACPTLPASMGGNKTPIIDELALEFNAEPWVEGYHADLMDGEPPLKEIPKHVKLRRMSMNEAAAIQGFRYLYPFQGNASSRWSQIGNAVPPLLAKVAIQGLVDGLS